MVLRPIEADADRKLLSDAVGMLSQQERDIITMRFGLWGQKELTQKEVADRLGISPVLHLPSGKTHHPASAA